MNLFKNTFVNGLLLAFAVVVTDYLQSIVNHVTMSTNAFIVAGAIALIGFIGKFLTGTANTNVAMIGSALLAIIPLISDGTVDWKLLIATFLLKLFGLLTQGGAEPKQTESRTQFNARM
jgi:hypothetical protein